MVLQTKLSNVTRNKNNVTNYIRQAKSVIYYKGEALSVEVEHIGIKIKLARERKGLTLKELGERANGMTHAALSKIENGVNKPSRRTLTILAKVLKDNFGDESLDEYINQSETSPPSKKEIVQDMTAREFVSLKFGGKNIRRSKQELDMLTKLLDAEIERMKQEDDYEEN